MPTTLNKMLDEIMGRVSEATPGPWKMWDGYGPRGDGMMMCAYLGTEDVHVVSSGNDIAAKREDFEFIAHARADVPRLVAIIRKLLVILKEHDIIPPGLDGGI